ncbi:MAG: hypothetical protein L3K26_09550 [Candidatus Hydrogenedentes bacterium]|nr:hypothetical protein [Candidatus Hydrogenedentota bacterium]
MSDGEAKAGHPPAGEFLRYQAEDGRTRIECRLQNESIWSRASRWTTTLVAGGWTFVSDIKGVLLNQTRVKLWANPSIKNTGGPLMRHCSSEHVV